MLFNSWEFAILLGITFLLYYLPLGRWWQVTLLLVSSSVFYAWNNPILLVLLAVSCIGNSVAAERIIHWKREEKGGGPARRWLAWAVAGNLALLLFFKYAGFLAGLLPDGWLPAGSRDWARAIPLPVGISFYTFQGISLLVDVWRGDLQGDQVERLSAKGRGRVRAVTDLSFYISFFPQLVAGPIVKAREFVGQIGGKRFADIRWATVTKALILGYFLKMVVADNLAEQTVVLTKPWITYLGPVDVSLLLYGYSFQIFADFAGYSLIAIGLGALFGYRLPRNFNFPYLSTSITEFWQRWHLSLSSWLRDYLYIPLGGNRRGPGRTYANLFIVMFLGGLWHGAEWKFALWGSLHGILLAVERAFFRRAGPAKDKPRSRVRAVLGWFYTFHAATLLWLTFLMPDMEQIGLFFRQFAEWDRLHGPPVFVCVIFGTAVVLYHAAAWMKEHRGDLVRRWRGTWAEGAVYGLLLFLILTNPGPPQGFIYFQF